MTITLENLSIGEPVPTPGTPRTGQPRRHLGPATRQT